MSETAALETIGRLLEATNAHDPDRIAECFALDYRNDTPAHPSRGFTGREQVRRNWSAILAGVPDLRAEMTDSAPHLDDVWCEWTMSGTRRDGAPHRMVGPIVFTVRDGSIAAARFYLEPVDPDGGSVDAAVRRAVGVAR